MACESRFHAFERCLPARGLEPLVRRPRADRPTGERLLTGTPFDAPLCTIS